jgi:hypothetical protein
MDQNNIALQKLPGNLSPNICKARAAGPSLSLYPWEAMGLIKKSNLH